MFPVFQPYFSCCLPSLLYKLWRLNYGVLDQVRICHAFWFLLILVSRSSLNPGNSQNERITQSICNCSHLCQDERFFGRFFQPSWELLHLLYKVASWSPLTRMHTCENTWFLRVAWIFASGDNCFYTPRWCNVLVTACNGTNLTGRLRLRTILEGCSIICDRIKRVFSLYQSTVHFTPEPWVLFRKAKVPTWILTLFSHQKGSQEIPV